MKAQRRGVKVQAILDKSQRSELYSPATFLANAGVPVRIDDNHQIGYNKVIIIDSARVITGSFNFSKAAEERNAENVLTLEDPALALGLLEELEEARRTLGTVRAEEPVIVPINGFGYKDAHTSRPSGNIRELVRSGLLYSPCQR